jgi:hypothetical protein
MLPDELPRVLKDALAIVQGGIPPWSACSFPVPRHALCFEAVPAI